MRPGEHPSENPDDHPEDHPGQQPAAMPSIYFEDIEPGAKVLSEPYRVPQDEMLAFARRWNPLPHHIDARAAAASPFGGLTAPGLYTLAVKQVLADRIPQAVIASMGYDEVRFPTPVRPGDELTLELLWVEKRESRSRPDRGIVKLRFTLRNQAGETVLSHLDTILVRRRGPVAD
jgi:acyl dehydratase